MRIVTHTNVDIDGLVAVEKLKRFGREKIPGISEATVIFWDGSQKNLDKILRENEQVIFVDINPKGIVHNPKKGIYVFGHHPHGDFPGETGSSLVDKFLGLENSKNLEVTRWAYRADFATGGDPMNIANVLKEMHLNHNGKSDIEIQNWFSMTAAAHFQTEEIDFQKGIEFFKSILKKFLSENPNSPAERILKKWAERSKNAIEDQMNIVCRTAVNLTVFGPEKTEDWLINALQGVHKGQEVFRQAKEDFEKAKKMVVGKKVLVSAITNNPRFNRFCRSAEAKEMMPRAMGDRESPIVLQIQPGKGFQIFSNGSGYKLFDVVGVIRTEILKARDKEVPFDWRTLKQEGTLNGTEPLYYQKGNYEIIMWGSLTSPAVKSLDIPVETVERIMLTVIDQKFFPRECQQSDNCLRENCQLYPWQMLRCFRKRQTQKV